MQHNEGTIETVEDVKMYYQVWRPDDPPRATLLIVHGLGEHGGRYTNVVNQLTPKGYVIYAMDNRGHGRSPGQQGYIDDWSVLREDLRAFVQFVQEEEAGRPFFLMGHSMGGCITLNYVLHYPDGLTGVVASAPAVGQLNVPPVMAFMSKLLAKIKPDLSVATGLDAGAVSRDPAVVTAYNDDPLVHGKGSPGAVVQFVETAEWTMTHAADFQPPLLLIHGDADQLVNVEGSRQFFEKVKQADKKLIIYEGGYHESHNDLHKEEMLADLETWLEAHM
ncbi:MAG: alpha/beta hydrolase [Chloroflexi bacterium]|nr:alpha/beta hydrolase [Chloroflexota bacterium]